MIKCSTDTQLKVISIAPICHRVGFDGRGVANVNVHLDAKRRPLLLSILRGRHDLRKLHPTEPTRRPHYGGVQRGKISLNPLPLFENRDSVNHCKSPPCHQRSHCCFFDVMKVFPRFDHATFAFATLSDSCHSSSCFHCAIVPVKHKTQSAFLKNLERSE